MPEETLEYKFSCPLQNGLHARPASLLAELASRFSATISLSNERNALTADATSVLDLVAGGFLYGDMCRLRVSGPEAPAAYSALVEFISGSLADIDTPLPLQPAITPGKASLPNALRGHADNWLGGIPASPGTALSTALPAGGISLGTELDTLKQLEPWDELQLFLQARSQLLARLDDQLRHSVGKIETEIRQAMLALARDASLQDTVAKLIRDQGLSAAHAVQQAIRSFSDRLASSGSTYLQERRGDLDDIGLQLLEAITGKTLRGRIVQLSEPAIVVAASLSTSSMLALDKQLLRGLVLGESGLTSHTVILARSHGIPVVCGVNELDRISGGSQLFIDGGRGIVIPDPGPAVQRYQHNEHVRSAAQQLKRASLAQLQGRTADGRTVEIAANIASPDELDAALENGAEGIGLLRTELLFAAYPAMPSEDEQTRIYTEMATRLDGRRLIIRTVDIGGDKPLPWLPLPHEENPFLGLRGIRLYPGNVELIQTQLRAVLRASAQGLVWLMAPMLSSVEELLWLRGQLLTAQAALRERKVPFNENMPLGLMIEVPSAALQIRQLSAHCDFFSIGSNDLTQYLLAVDRGNSQVAELYRELHPALLRLLKLICDEARDCGRWIGLCGEFGARSEHAQLLAALGLDEVSMSAPSIPAFKQALAKCDSSESRDLLDRCIACSDAEEVRLLLREQSAASGPVPLLSAELVNLASESRSKAEAIRELCGVCLLAGRTASIDGLEDDVWDREATYSTGLGFGIAIPHCKSRHVAAPSLALLRLQTALDWGSLDGQAVDTVLLLAMPEQSEDNAHLRIFARLARRLMNVEFRAGLRSADSADNIVEFLALELELTE